LTITSGKVIINCNGGRIIGSNIMSIGSGDRTERRLKGEWSLYYSEVRDLLCAQVGIGTDSHGERIRKTVTVDRSPILLF